MNAREATAVRASSDSSRAQRRSRGGGRSQVPWWLVVPGLLAAVSVHLAAPLAGAWYAFTDWNGVGPATWVGLENFRDIFENPATRTAMLNTVKLAATFVILVNTFGLALALAVNRVLKTRNLLRSVFFLPVAMSSLAVAFLWQYIFQFEGPLNQVLGGLGLESWQRAWLADPTWALWTVLVVLVWQYSGLAMVLYLAGLQTIPDELLEAAAVDGASSWTRFRRIVFPMLAPAFTVSVTLMSITGLRVFDQVLALTGGGPAGASETMSTMLWKETWVNGRFGYGAAVALILTLLVGSLAITQAVLLRRREARI
jgi:raffinose/stachyose/melibiose transport system permease protein